VQAQKAQVDTEKQLVVFTISGEEFGIEITQVREIIKLREITRLPHTLDFVEGVTNLRGEVIPVIDLKKRFGIGSTERDDDNRIIIAEVHDTRVGFIVDSVTETLRIPASAIEPPPRNVAGLKADYLVGIGKLENRLLIVLDACRILSSEERIQLQQEALSTELASIADEA
jgi:purine-binding chemotaxis protein CheW